MTLPILLFAKEMVSFSSSFVFEKEGGLGTICEGHEVEGNQDDLRVDEDPINGLSRNSRLIDPLGN